MNPNNVSAPDPKEEFAQTPNLPKETPTPTLPNIGVDHTVQPISSEAEIRQAVAANTPDIIHNSISVDPQSLTQSPERNSNEMHYNPTNLNPVSLAAPAVNASNDTQPPKKKYKWLVLPIILLALFASGYFAYRYFYLNAPLPSSTNVISSSDTLKVKDLINVYVSNTNFQKPKQWVATNYSGEIYRDSSGTNDIPIAYVFMIYSNNKHYDLANASNAVYETQRNTPQPTGLDLDVSAQMLIERTGQKCTSKPIEKIAADRYVISNSVGLYLKTVTCPTTQGGVTAKERTIVGRDGYLRTIMIAAPDKQWSIDSEVFNIMLNSIQQA